LTRPYPSEKSLSNLRPFNKQSEDERKRANSNGGKKGTATQKEMRTCEKFLRVLLSKNYKVKNFSTKNSEGKEALMSSLLYRAIVLRDVQAIKLVLSIIGEMPTPELSIKSEKEEKDNGMLEDLLQANLEIQKKLMGGKDNG